MAKDHEPQHAHSSDHGTVRAWDLPTRAFHWALVVLIVSAYLSHRLGDPVFAWGRLGPLAVPTATFPRTDLLWHKWNGYLILILVVYRIIWGFVGGSTARFKSFVRGPLTAARYGIDFAAGRPRHFLGHNPLGGLMVVSLLAIVAVQASIGLFSYDDHDYNAGGPLAGRVSEAWMAFFTRWHVRIFDLILIMVALHIMASLIYLLWKRDNLIRPMLTGTKPRKAYEDCGEAEFGSIGKAALCLAIAAILVLGGIRMAGGRIF